MKKIILLTVIQFYLNLLNAQELKVACTEVKMDSYIELKAAGLIGDKIYQVHGGSEECFLAVYGLSDYKKISENKFKQKKCRKSYCIDDHFNYSITLFLKNKILIFFDSYEKTSESKVLLVQEFDLNGGFVGKLVEVDNIPSKKSKNVSFTVKPNEDSTQFAVICQTDDGYKDDSDKKLAIKLYDYNLKNIVNMAVTLPYHTDKIYLEDFKLWNGKVLILGSEQKYLLFTLDMQNNKVSEYKLNFTDKNVWTSKFDIDYKNNTVFIGGIYFEAKKEKSKEVKSGFFLVSVDANTNQVKNTTFEAIANSDIAFTRNMILNTDGSITIIAEDTRAIPGSHFGRSSDGGFETTRWTDYVRNSLAIINIDSNGKSNPVGEVKKWQSSRDDDGYYCSFVALHDNNNTFVAYNDDPRNITEKKHDYSMPRPKKASFILTEVKRDGTYTQKIIFNNKEQELIPVPEKGFNLGKGIYIVPVKDLSCDRAGTIKLEL